MSKHKEKNPLTMFKEKPTSFDEELAKLDMRHKEALKKHCNKQLKNLPNMPGITQETKKHLKFKSFFYMLSHDKDHKILRSYLKHPIKYGWRYVRSLFKKISYQKDDDFFLYGIDSTGEFENLLKDPNSILIAGFSYCHKPLECPSGRFTDACQNNPSNPVCGQCFIGKCLHLVPKNRTFPYVIPTVHYIGEKVFSLAHQYPEKKILFLISACEMTLEMFGDWGNMVGIKGIGIRLDGRICNTMKAFELSERGIKPGLTVVLSHTQERLLKLIKKTRQYYD